MNEPPARVEQEVERLKDENSRLRVGCEAALIDWQHQRLVDDGGWSPRPGAKYFLEGCVAVYDQVIPLLEKVLDGTAADDDFDEAEYDLMLAAGTTERTALRAVTQAENERIRQAVRVRAALAATAEQPKD